MKHDYFLSNESQDTCLPEFARVIKAEHRIEECLQRAKSEAGLADYEVRTWRGWHHHQTLSLISTWFLTQEARSEKKIHSRNYGFATPQDFGFTAAQKTQLRSSRLHQPPMHPPIATQREREILSLEAT